jgi:GTP cyclohydrolase IB
MKSLRSDWPVINIIRFRIEGKLDERTGLHDICISILNIAVLVPVRYELAEHARETRDVAAIPHSQRVWQYHRAAKQ